MTKTRGPITKLRRGESSLSLSAPSWSNVLLLASKCGWQPERPSYFFIASGFDVRDSEAYALAQTIEDIWTALSKDPFSDKLDPAVNVAQLLEVGAFCLGGGFTVEPA